MVVKPIYTTTNGTVESIKRISKDQFAETIFKTLGRRGYIPRSAKFKKYKNVIKEAIRDKDKDKRPEAVVAEVAKKLVAKKLQTKKLQLTPKTLKKIDWVLCSINGVERYFPAEVDPKAVNPRFVGYIKITSGLKPIKSTKFKKPIKEGVAKFKKHFKSGWWRDERQISLYMGSANAFLNYYFVHGGHVGFTRNLTDGLIPQLAKDKYNRSITNCKGFRDLHTKLFRSLGLTKLYFGMALMGNSSANLLPRPHTFVMARIPGTRSVLVGDNRFVRRYNALNTFYSQKSQDNYLYITYGKSVRTTNRVYSKGLYRGYLEFARRKLKQHSNAIADKIAGRDSLSADCKKDLKFALRAVDKAIKNITRQSFEVKFGRLSKAKKVRVKVFLKHYRRMIAMALRGSVTKAKEDKDALAFFRNQIKEEAARKGINPSNDNVFFLVFRSLVGGSVSENVPNF